ncbi:MAG TPA: hypothetical protein DCQ64_20050 [Candidatus Rokubacteria bacterium]|nr:hypothetical protein [Candidatus Rokubacteria bacterium]
MALLKPTTKRLDIPGEPDQWVVIRRVADCELPVYHELVGPRALRTQALVQLFVAAIVSWSYPEAPTFDVIAGVPNKDGVREGGLDAATATWLHAQILALSRGDAAAELFPSASPSSAT